MSNDEAMNQICDMFSYIDGIETHDLKEAQRLMEGEKAKYKLVPNLLGKMVEPPATLEAYTTWQVFLKKPICLLWNVRLS